MKVILNDAFHKAQTKSGIFIYRTKVQDYQIDNLQMSYGKTAFKGKMLLMAK